MYGLLTDNTDDMFYSFRTDDSVMVSGRIIGKKPG